MTGSYLPQGSGVTNSVVRATAELRRPGMKLSSSPGKRTRVEGHDETIVRTAAVGLAWYKEVKVGLATRDGR